MKVLTAPAPKTPQDTVNTADAFQMIANHVVKKAVFNPYIQVRGIDVPRVYVELTHTDTWTVNSNDPDHPELEQLVADAIHQHLEVCQASLADFREGKYLTTQEFLAQVRSKIAQ